MSAMQKQVQTQEEKVINVSRLVKLLQSYCDAQEEEGTGVKQSMKNIHQRLDELTAELHGDEKKRPRRGISPLASQYGSIESTAMVGKEIESRISALENQISRSSFISTHQHHP